MASRQFWISLFIVVHSGGSCFLSIALETVKVSASRQAAVISAVLILHFWCGVVIEWRRSVKLRVRGWCSAFIRDRNTRWSQVENFRSVNQSWIIPPSPGKFFWNHFGLSHFPFNYRLRMCRNWITHWPSENHTHISFHFSLKMPPDGCHYWLYICNSV